MTWYAAKDRCKEKGGKLVEIDSREENMFLVLEINRKGYDNNNNAPTTYNDDNNKKKIIWNESSTVETSQILQLTWK